MFQKQVRVMKVKTIKALDIILPILLQNLHFDKLFLFKEKLLCARSTNYVRVHVVKMNETESGV